MPWPTIMAAIEPPMVVSADGQSRYWPRRPLAPTIDTATAAKPPMTPMMVPKSMRATPRS